MRLKEVGYEKTISKNFNNVKIGVVLEPECGDTGDDTLDKAREFVERKLKEESDNNDLPF